MNLEETITIHFSLPFKVKPLFDFIIKPENMILYEGFLLVPGIKTVDSSDKIRKSGTIDRIINTDGSSHESLTEILVQDEKYFLSLSNIQVVGIKKKLANPIVGIRERWSFHSKNADTEIERTLTLIYKKSFLNTFIIKFLIAPLMHFSLLKHHQNILKKMSHK